MNNLLEKTPRFIFFTGKGGVGKTSISCAVAVGLADSGKKVLLISTDPASNLSEVLNTEVTTKPQQIKGLRNLFAMNINPIKAAEQYREKMVSPYRGVLPDEAIEQMEEQLSGACTVEIAGFNEFSKFIGDENIIGDYEHIVLDTAPTGHTLRLLNLPSAWNDFIATNQTGSSCLGPVSGLKEQKALYEKVLSELKNPEKTLLVLVATAEKIALLEAEKASRELKELGIKNQHLVINAIFENGSDDKIAKAFAIKSQKALEEIPQEIENLPSTRISYCPKGIIGIESLREICKESGDAIEKADYKKLNSFVKEILKETWDWHSFIDGLESKGYGVIMTMGKGGVGKTTIASAIAVSLAERGNPVLLSTTDPAAHIQYTVDSDCPNLEISRIDPKAETNRYVSTILERNREKLSKNDMALLEEELRSPCIEEVAVFEAFARTVAKGKNKFIVLDTAPTGHTLLLLDSTQSFHREVEKTSDGLPSEVKELLPLIRDPSFTCVLIVTLAEATPVHEAAYLQNDLLRAGIKPFGWIINRSFAISDSKDPLLFQKGLTEIPYINEVINKHSSKTLILPWITEDTYGIDNLKRITV
ncbi:MAG: arsenical pump-driving ATPase [Candidatus Schekmanbacteria bacterium]|nr:MAG: arsenical pump-driving ATPase [Candidatus Schekmanbacteria bacterium]